MTLATQSDAAVSFQRLRLEIIRFLNAGIQNYAGQSQILLEARHAFEHIHLPDPFPAPRRLPGCKHLAAALEFARSGPMSDLANAFFDFEPHLQWIRTEHYREKLGDDYMNNYCYANVLGYDAIVPHERIVAAFFVIGPGRHYPPHHHAAEEIYFPFGGDTLWGQGDTTPAERSAGEPIHNPPWLTHEMITRNTPLFCFCLWFSPGPIQLAELTND